MCTMLSRGLVAVLNEECLVYLLLLVDDDDDGTHSQQHTPDTNFSLSHIPNPCPMILSVAIFFLFGNYETNDVCVSVCPFGPTVIRSTPNSVKIIIPLEELHIGPARRKAYQKYDIQKI